MGNGGVIFMNIKKVQKQIIKLDFANAYRQLYESNYSFNFDDLSRDFPKVNSLKMYLFLMYTITQDEDVKKHLAICYYLYFINPYILGAEELIKWHLKKALEISPYNEDVLKNWIFGVYNGNPDNPFTDEEMSEYSCRLKEIYHD